MDLLNNIKAFLQYYLGAKTYYNLHSPRIYEFITNTLEDDRSYYAFDKIEEIRTHLLQDNTRLQILDLGAGSKTSKEKTRTIKEIASSALSPSYQCKLLFRIVQYLKPRHILELGTSLGISTMYLAEGNTKAKLTSIEGSQAIADIALRNFSYLKQTQIKLKVGNFDEILPNILPQIENLDLVYIDGNHQYEPTIKYFEMILPYLNENSLVIFDDIYWSKEMSQAWQEIKASNSVSQTIDLYFFGLVMFKQDFKEKQDHKITYSTLKPWQKYIPS